MENSSDDNPENIVGENTVGENTVGENTVGENTVGENTVGENAVVENANDVSSEQARKTKAEESQKIDPSQIPPASFPLMISMFSTQAMGALGILPNPITGKVDFQPVLAKHYIEMLAILEEKTKGNLDPNESKMLESSLHELRMTYVQVTKK